MEILRVEHIRKVYGTGDARVVALDDISFTIQKGEFVAIIGPSGSGKSTLLHILGGVDRPTSGKVYIENTDLYSLKETPLAIFRRRQIGLIYQFNNLIPVLNVEENISLPLLLDERKPNREQMTEMMQLLGVQNRASHLPNQLSGGQQQRVSIGRALICNPAIVLADEPTGNLDSKNSADVMDLLRTSNRRFNQTLLLITHDQNIALQADRIITLSDGSISRDEVIRS
jgi:putative ABC transport system ATP-binding protein